MARDTGASESRASTTFDVPREHESTPPQGAHAIEPKEQHVYEIEAGILFGPKVSPGALWTMGVLSFVEKIS